VEIFGVHPGMGRLLAFEHARQFAGRLAKDSIAFLKKATGEWPAGCFGLSTGPGFALMLLTLWNWKSFE